MAKSEKGNSNNRQLVLNMASSMAVFALNLCVSFFLTPFIVKTLGTAAYGFVGLSNNIIGYASLLTVAINSMAGRFITISVHKNDYTQANAYVSSIFFANIILASFILASFIVVTIFLPHLINIPPDLITDVQTLFITLGISSCLGLLTGVFSVTTFIRNRLDISNTRSLFGTIIRVVLMLALFGLFIPKLWYFGVAALVMNVYVISTNFYFFRKLTPDLHIRRRFFKFSKIKEVTASGAWNIISRLSGILSKGFDLLLANLFISAWAMGILSITLVIPSLVLSFFGSICGNFSPNFTKLYAEGNMQGLKNDLLKSIRLCGFVCCIPLSIIFAYSDIFYRYWLPSENCDLLYLITVLGSFGMVVAMPLEPLWNIFTIANKVKRSSLNLLYNSVASFAVVLASMFVVESDFARLIILASTRMVFGAIRCVSFLPLYGSKCLGFKRSTFYPITIKNVINIIIVTGGSILFKLFFLESSIAGLIIGAIFTTVFGFALSFYTILQKNDRQYLIDRIKPIIFRK